MPQLDARTVSIKLGYAPKIEGYIDTVDAPSEVPAGQTFKVKATAKVKGRGYIWWELWEMKEGRMSRKIDYTSRQRIDTTTVTTVTYESKSITMPNVDVYELLIRLMYEV